MDTRRLLVNFAQWLVHLRDQARHGLGLLSAIATTLAVAQGGCSTKSSATPTPGTVDAIVGVAGGSVTSEGVTIEIPPGALAGDTHITISKSSQTAANAVGPVFDIGPDGTQFAKPVTLALPYDPAKLASATPGEVMVETLTAGRSDPAPWAAVDPTKSSVVGLITHLSPWYAAVIPHLRACVVDQKCVDSCCTPKGGSVLASSCAYAVCQGVPYLDFTECYADCFGSRKVKNFISSPCLHDCCTSFAGDPDPSTGICLLSTPVLSSVVSCAAGCFITGKETGAPTICGGGASANPADCTSPGAISARLTSCYDLCAQRSAPTCDLKANPPVCLGGILRTNCHGNCLATGSNPNPGPPSFCGGMCDAAADFLCCQGGKLEGGCQSGDPQCDAACAAQAACP